jgi:hypothetical protein
VQLDFSPADRGAGAVSHRARDRQLLSSGRERQNEGQYEKEMGRN